MYVYIKYMLPSKWKNRSLARANGQVYNSHNIWTRNAYNLLNLNIVASNVHRMNNHTFASRAKMVPTEQYYSVVLHSSSGNSKIKN